MRRLLLVLILLALPSPLQAQIFVRYERRTRHSYLSIRTGHYAEGPWYGGHRPAVWVTPMPIYTTGTILYTPLGGQGPVGVIPAPTPWNPPANPPPPSELSARYTRYAAPPAPVGAALALKLASLVEAATAAMKQGDPKGAAAAMREALLIAPDAGPGRPPLEAVFAAVLAAIGDARHADKAVAEAVRRDPAAAHPELIDLFPSSAAFDKMLAGLEKGATHGRLTAAWLHRAVGRADRARTILDAILKDAPDHPSARALRATLN